VERLQTMEPRFIIGESTFDWVQSAPTGHRARRFRFGRDGLGRFAGSARCAWPAGEF